MSKLDITFTIWEQIKEKIDDIFGASMLCTDCLYSIPHDVCHYPTDKLTYLTIGELFTTIIDIASANNEN